MNSIKIQTLFLLLMSFALNACQSAALSDFNQIKVGMDKEEVINLMGSPDRTERFHGKDKWTYIFYDKKSKYEKELQFQNGNCIYVGDIWEPEESKSALVVDKKNNELEAKFQEEQAEKKKLQSSSSSDYSEFEKSSHNEDKIKYMPTFTPVQ